MPALGAAGTPTPAPTAARLSVEFAAFAALLFVARFLARAHLVPQTDQECHIGGIAVDVLAHGIRFPLLAYAPNEYDNGSFFSGLLAAAVFSLLGRNVLALKLVTHLICAAGAVATLWLLRGCLAELGTTSRRARWTATAALVVALALAPRIVTLSSTYGVGNHAEGSAIDTILLALFARRLHARSAARTAGFWTLVGFAAYVNKGTLLVIPVLGAAELALGWRARRRLAAALGGLVAGALPELLVIVSRHGMGWATMAAKAERNSQAFPRAFLDGIWSLAEDRVELLAVWVLALAAGAVWFARSLRTTGGDTREGDTPPVALGLVVGVTILHVAALTVMAQGSLDAYTIYSYPTLAVLSSLLVAALCARVALRWGDAAATWAGAGAIALTLALYRPDALAWDLTRAAAWWRNGAGAACSWRFAEGFEREHQYGLARLGDTREEHAIVRCRSLSERAQVLDCIGGIARELHWRQDGTIAGEPPAGLDADERRAYAYHYGTHRHGDRAACADFASPALAADCAAAVQLECLVFADMVTRLASAQSLGQPRCAIPEPPMDGYWAAMRADLLSRPAGPSPQREAAVAETDLRACAPVFEACY